MLLILKEIKELQDRLERAKEERQIEDYKIILKLNLKIHVLIFCETSFDVKTIGFGTINESYIFELINRFDIESDPHYKDIFQSLKTNNSKEDRIDLGIRRRFSHLINYNAPTKDFKSTIPLVTFYSYKGGMGRSTTLASFASYLAYHYKKKVLIIDCDFEAPGFTNYFDITYDVLTKKNGVVEYLIDRQYKGTSLDLDKYIIEVDKDFTNEGSIYVMPAGNLTENKVDPDNPSLGIHRDHYLEALARLDISGSDYIIHQFNTLLQDVESSSYKPDLILIDSRTGFNDIFGLTAFNFSEIVVGFFGNNAQTRPGLQFFIDVATRINKKYNVVIVNSIISDFSLFEGFKNEIENYMSERFQDMEQLPLFQYFPINRNPTLERIGTRFDNKLNFIKLISNNLFSDYTDLFEGIYQKLNDIIELKRETVAKTEIDKNDDREIGENAEEVISEGQFNVKVVGRVDLQNNFKKGRSSLTTKEMFRLKKSLLEELIADYLEPYAEDVVFDEKFLTKRFYFRPKMYNVFNKEKFLIIGGKGTGKTSLYKALQTPLFTNILKERAGKSKEKYYSTNIVSLQNDKQHDKLLKITGNFDINQISGYEKFFKRFWLVYVWNAILIDINSNKYLSHLKTNLGNPGSILNDTVTTQRFTSIIDDDNQIIEIEKTLKLVDEELRKENTHLIVLFDQLDFICKPIDWDKSIAPLINYWRGNQFSRIMPKIFLRTDLFNKLGNLTNKQELRNQSIDIEWSQEEIFSFFFKWVLSSSSGQFTNLLKAYKDYSEEIIEQIQQSTYNQQVPTERRLLEPYVNTFFGKYADRRGVDIKFGLSYDWFYSNLKNADNTISLRPFLDLIKTSISFYLEPTNNDTTYKPILSAYYFAAPSVRKEAVRRHFDDLADEEGNQDLKIVFNYISKLPPGIPKKKSYLRKKEFDGLLAEIINENSNIQNRDIDSLKDLLIVNGIVAEVPVGGGYLNYRFAFLYKYFLGLK